MEAKIREKERQQQEEKNERIKEKKAEESELSTESVVATETVETEATPAVKEMIGGGDIKVEVHATAVHHDQVVEPRLSHAMNHEISHSQATYSVRRVEMSDNKNMYVTVSFAGVALMVALLIGVVVMRRRNK